MGSEQEQGCLHSGHSCVSAWLLVSHSKGPECAFYIYYICYVFFIYIYICIIKEFDVSSNDWCIRKTQDNYPHSTFQFSVKGLLLELLELL